MGEKEIQGSYDHVIIEELAGEQLNSLKSSQKIDFKLAKSSSDHQGYGTNLRIKSKLNFINDMENDMQRMRKRIDDLEVALKGKDDLINSLANRPHPSTFDYDENDFSSIATDRSAAVKQHEIGLRVFKDPKPDRKSSREDSSSEKNAVRTHGRS